MIWNKKAQNITKPYTIILIIVIIASFSGIILKVGQDIAATSGNVLTNESKIFIYDQSGFDYQNITLDDTEDPFYSSDTDSEGNLKDDALEFRFFQERSSDFRSIFQAIWNVPSFFFKMANIDNDENWAIFINAWNTVIWSIIGFGVYRLIRGLL